MDVLTTLEKSANATAAVARGVRPEQFESPTQPPSGAPPIDRLAAFRGRHPSKSTGGGAGGGWSEMLSGLKTLLGTGHQLPFQSGPPPK